MNVVGHRIAECSLQLGSLHPAPEAHRLGLVDELVPEEKLMEKAAAVMAQWLALPGKSVAEEEGTWSEWEAQMPGLVPGSCITLSIKRAGLDGWRKGKFSPAVLAALG